jgi:hypothetical protein
MKRLTDFSRQYPLAAFFILTPLISLAIMLNAFAEGRRSPGELLNKLFWGQDANWSSFSPLENSAANKLPEKGVS